MNNKNNTKNIFKNTKNIFNISELNHLSNLNTPTNVEQDIPVSHWEDSDVEAITSGDVSTVVELM